MPPKRAAPRASGSGSQAPSRPNQRRRAAETPEDPEEDGSVDVEDSREEQDQGQGQNQEEETQRGGKGLKAEDIKRCAAKLVRMALFHEYQRKVLRRDIISRDILPANARSSFNAVFQHAQMNLRQNFGMELYELRPRSKGAAAMEGETQATQARTQAQTQSQAQAPVKRKKGLGRGMDAIHEEEEDEDEEEEEDNEEAGATARSEAAKKAPGSKTYVLRSILPPELLSLVSTPRPLPVFEGLQNPNDHVDSGAIIPWEKADGGAAGHVALLGIRTIILCLVMCTGRTISDDHLHALLRRLNLLRETILSYASPDSKEPHMTLDKYLDLLARQQYLEKVKVPVAPGVEPATEWRWGNREAEFTETAAAKFIESVFFADVAESDDEEEDGDAEANTRQGRRDAANAKQERAAERQRQREKLKTDIAQAVGGPLMD